MDFFDSDKSYLKTAKIIKAQQNPLNPSPLSKNKTERLQ